MQGILKFIEMYIRDPVGKKIASTHSSDHDEQWHKGPGKEITYNEQHQCSQRNKEQHQVGVPQESFRCAGRFLYHSPICRMKF